MHSHHPSEIDQDKVPIGVANRVTFANEAPLPTIMCVAVFLVGWQSNVKSVRSTRGRVVDLEHKPCLVDLTSVCENVGGSSSVHNLS